MNYDILGAAAFTNEIGIIYTWVWRLARRDFEYGATVPFSGGSTARGWLCPCSSLLFGSLETCAYGKCEVYILLFFKVKI